MLDDLDRKIKLDIFITIIATFISVDFIVASYIWNKYALQILSILVIVLPTIYIVGNLIIRGILDKELRDLRKNYDETIVEASKGIEEMKQEIDKLKG